MFSLAFALSAATLLQFPDPLQRPVFAVKNVRVETGVDPAQDGVTLLVRDGRIEALGKDAAIPIDADVVDGTGLVAAPAFIDAWSTRLLPDASGGAGGGGDDAGRFRGPRADRAAPTGGPAATVDEGIAVPAMDLLVRPGVKPADRALDSITFDPEKTKSLRETGFGIVLAAPSGPMIAGRSSLVALAADWSPSALVADDVALHLSFRAPPSDNYPSTLMGVLAELRQTFADARWQEDAWKRFEASGGTARRAALDARLAALAPARDRKQPVVFEADTALDIVAALDLAKELNVRPIIAGGAEAFRVATRLKQEDVPVIVALDFPDEPKGLKKKEAAPASAPASPADATAKSEPAEKPDAPPGARRGPRRRGNDGADAKPDAPADAPADATTDAKDAKDSKDAKDAKPDEPTLPQRALEEQDQRRQERIANAKELAAAGVRFAFSTRGQKSIPQFRENLALAVAAGLDRDRALRALTSDAATILGASSSCGTIATGRAATFALFDGDPLAKDTHVRTMVVDGRRFAFKAAPKGGKPDAKDKGKSNAPGASSGNAGGTWQIEMDSGGEKREYTVELTQDGASLSGSARSSRGTGEITAGSVNETSVSFTAVFQFGSRRYEFQYEGELNGDTLTGTVTVKAPEGGVGEPRPFTATRSPQPHSDVDEADEVRNGDEP